METIYHLVGACGEHGLTHPTVWMVAAVMAGIYMASKALEKQPEQT